MKVSQKAIELLQQRLKNLDVSVENIELEQLANAITAMSKLETTDDILDLGAAKLAEISECGNEKITEIDDLGIAKQTEFLTAKDSKLSDVSASKLSSLDSVSQVFAEKQDEINSLVDDFAEMNDVPDESTICPEISNNLDRYKFLNSGDLPFVFGILSRYDDYYSGTTSTLSSDVMLGILTGCHDYTTLASAGFYSAPKLCFLQGSQGNFIKRKHYTKYTYTTSQYQYPYAAVGCLFVKNTTESDITSTLTFGCSSYASTGGANVFVGVPNTATETITWTTAYSYTSSSSGVSLTVNITVPANSTVVVMLYSSSYFISAPTDGKTTPTSYYYHAQFLHWRLIKIRSDFLTEGLEIDFDKTLKAWQCPGFSSPFELLKPTASI
ncbi:hypothetical protein FACS1894122_05480 [Alphaproteobacteria bacterium]|nr:hypothetical protein FACS1894122_05480 [Alphaproteobacteria bacterium]